MTNLQIWGLFSSGNCHAIQFFVKFSHMRLLRLFSDDEVRVGLFSEILLIGQTLLVLRFNYLCNFALSTLNYSTLNYSSYQLFALLNFTSVELYTMSIRFLSRLSLSNRVLLFLF